MKKLQILAVVVSIGGEIQRNAAALPCSYQIVEMMLVKLKCI